MMGPSHRVLGLTSWCVVAPRVGFPWWQIVVGALIASACSHGRLSPDVDLSARLRAQHRRLPHWPPVTITAALAAYRYLPEPYWWVAAAVLTGWASHLASDAVFGRIPVWPRARGGWRKMGLGLRTGGNWEEWVRAHERRVAIAGVALAAVTLMV